jgi:hypothetical protein
MSEHQHDGTTTNQSGAAKPPAPSNTNAKSTRDKVVAAVAAVAAILGLFVAWGVIDWQSSVCTRFRIGVSFAGTTRRLDDYLNTTAHSSQCVITDLGSLRGGLLIAALCGLAGGLILWWLLRSWWEYSWLTGPFHKAGSIAWVGVVAGVFSAVLNVAIAVSAHTSQGGTKIALARWMVGVMPVVAWPALLFGALSVIVLLLTWLAYWNRRGITVVDDLHHPPAARTGNPSQLAVSCSGGGIRAGAIALGVLGVLEQYGLDGVELTQYNEGHPESLDRDRSILAKVKFISSVSGGGYTAGAYRVALGTGASGSAASAAWPLGLMGAPQWYENEPPAAYDSLTTNTRPTLFRHLQARRQFLRTGRGGLPASVTVAVGSIILQLVLLVATVVLVAWPMGRLARTWPVYGGVGCQVASTASVCALINPAQPVDSSKPTPINYCDRLDGRLTHSASRTICFVKTPGRQMPVGWELLAPGAVLVVLGAIVFAVKMALWHTTRRHQLSVVSGVLGGTGAFFLLLLVGVPLALDVLYPKLSSWQTIVPTLTSLGAGTGIASRYITPRLKKTASTLGTALVLLAASVVAIIVAGHAALRSGVLAFPGDGFVSYGVVVLLMALAYIWLNPQTWSLNTLYRNRIRGAFGPTRDPEQAPRALRRARFIVDRSGKVDPRNTEQPGERIYPYRQRCEPTIDEFAGASGPVHLVCCSAARRDRVATGISALSYVISSEGVDLYEPRYGTAGRVDIDHFQGSARQFVTALEARRKKDRVTRFGIHRGQAYGTATAAMSASAAAVASSMGRDNHKYPVAALSLLNVRLGMWLPNPRYLAAIQEEQFTYPQPRLAYLLKEIAGYWQRDDHHLYVTDGGHRENLGLVELLRRRCKTIICIDSSGDVPGTFATLRQAADLAQIETRAWVDLSAINDLPPGRPATAHFLLPVCYDQADAEPTATIVYIRAVVFTKLEASLTAFAAEDPKFPNYSTGNQFLTDTQFNNLVEFGREAFLTALRDPDVLAAIQNAT